MTDLERARKAWSTGEEVKSAKQTKREAEERAAYILWAQARAKQARQIATSRPHNTYAQREAERAEEIARRAVTA